MKVTQKQINSFVIAILLSINALCYTLPILGIGGYFGIMYFLNIFVVGIAGVAFLMTNRKMYYLREKKFATVYAIIICMVYIFSMIIVPNYTYSINMFSCYFLIPVILVGIDFSVEVALRIMTIMSILIIPAYSGLFAYQWETFRQANMGNTYAILMWVSAALCHFVFYRETIKKKYYFIYIPGGVGFVGLVLYSSRGVVISLLILILVVLFNRKQRETGEVYKKSVKKKVAFLIVLILGYYMVVNFSAVYSIIYKLLDNILTEMPSFFVKMNNMIALEDVGNGRDEVYGTAIDGILNNPFFGRGIESFNVYTKFSYPHNFILQLLYEGGILFCIIPLWIVICTTYKLFVSRIENRDILVFVILLYVQVIPRFLISASVWKEYTFWLLIFYVLINYKHIILKQYR